MTRWGLLGLALKGKSDRKPPTSRDDSLVAGSGVASEREAPTSHCDSLGVVRAGVDGEKRKKTTNES